MHYSTVLRYHFRTSRRQALRSFHLRIKFRQLLSSPTTQCIFDCQCSAYIVSRKAFCKCNNTLLGLIFRSRCDPCNPVFVYTLQTLFFYPHQFLLLLGMPKSSSQCSPVPLLLFSFPLKCSYCMFILIHLYNLSFNRFHQLDDIIPSRLLHLQPTEGPDRLSDMYEIPIRSAPFHWSTQLYFHGHASK